jgi:hypothetical protein
MEGLEKFSETSDFYSVCRHGTCHIMQTETVSETSGFHSVSTQLVTYDGGRDFLRNVVNFR